MPALPLVNNALHAQLIWGDDQDTSVYTGLFFRYTGGPPNAAACIALAGDIGGAMALQNDCWHEDTALNACKVTDLSSNTGGVGEYAVGTAGTIVGEPVSGGTAVLANYQITRRYRGGKPRSYFPWGSASELATRQTWGGTYVTQCQNALEAFFAACVGSTSGGTTISAHASISYYDGFTVVTNPTTGRARNAPKVRLVPLVDDVVSLSVLGRPASQRRRNR